MFQKKTGYVNLSFPLMLQQIATHSAVSRKQMYSLKHERLTFCHRERNQSICLRFVSIYVMRKRKKCLQRMEKIIGNMVKDFRSGSSKFSFYKGCKSV